MARLRSQQVLAEPLLALLQKYDALGNSTSSMNVSVSTLTAIHLYETALRGRPCPGALLGWLAHRVANFILCA